MGEGVKHEPAQLHFVPTAPPLPLPLPLLAIPLALLRFFLILSHILWDVAGRGGPKHARGFVSLADRLPIEADRLTTFFWLAEGLTTFCRLADRLTTFFWLAGLLAECLKTFCGMAECLARFFWFAKRLMTFFRLAKRLMTFCRLADQLAERLSTFFRLAERLSTVADGVVDVLRLLLAAGAGVVAVVRGDGGV